jgi:hypothetical protein
MHAAAAAAHAPMLGRLLLGRWSTGQQCACLAPRQSVENDNNQWCSKQKEE